MQARWPRRPASPPPHTDAACRRRSSAPAQEPAHAAIRRRRDGSPRATSAARGRRAQRTARTRCGSGSRCGRRPRSSGGSRPSSPTMSAARGRCADPRPRRRPRGRTSNTRRRSSRSRLPAWRHGSSDRCTATQVVQPLRPEEVPEVRRAIFSTNRSGLRRMPRSAKSSAACTLGRGRGLAVDHLAAGGPGAPASAKLFANQMFSKAALSMSTASSTRNTLRAVQGRITAAPPSRIGRAAATPARPRPASHQRQKAARRRKPVETERARAANPRTTPEAKARRRDGSARLFAPSARARPRRGRCAGSPSWSSSSSRWPATTRRRRRPPRRRAVPPRDVPGTPPRPRPARRAAHCRIRKREEMRSEEPEHGAQEQVVEGRDRPVAVPECATRRSGARSAAGTGAARCAVRS